MRDHLESIGTPMTFIALSSTCSTDRSWGQRPAQPILPPLIERWNRRKRMAGDRYATASIQVERAARGIKTHTTEGECAQETGTILRE